MLIIKKLKIPLNLEIAATEEMLKIASKSKPPFICIVPEKRKEITTEGGLNFFYREKRRKIFNSLNQEQKKYNIFLGGGDTVSAIHNLNTEINFSHISTGGGASLELLSGNKLTALKDIEK